MENNEDLKLIVGYYDKEDHKNDDKIPTKYGAVLTPKYEIILNNEITFADKPQEIIENALILIVAQSNPEFYKFRKITLESKLDDKCFSRVNSSLKNMVEIYNHIGG